MQLRPRILSPLLLLTAACGARHAVAPANDACVIRGTQMLYPSAILYASDHHGTPIGDSPGSVARFELSEIGAGDNGLTRANVRVPIDGPALVLRGYVELRELELFATRDIEVVTGHVAITKGTRVRVVHAGTDGTFQVVASGGPFTAIKATATCDALGLEKSPELPRTPRGQAAEHATHIADGAVSLYDERGGELLSLGSASTGATLTVTESRGDLRHVRYDNGVHIDAWMRAKQLVLGEGPDCDDCDGGPRDLDDRCPDYSTDQDEGCPDTGDTTHVVAMHDVDIHMAASLDSPVVGTLERGAAVLVIKDKKQMLPPGWSRIRPLLGELTPGNSDFVVESSALVAGF